MHTRWSSSSGSEVASNRSFAEWAGRMHELLGALRELVKPPPRDQLVVHPAPEPPRRRLLGGPDLPSRRGIFYLATVFAFTTTLGSLGSGVYLSREHAGRVRADVPALDMLPAPRPDVGGERAFGEVLMLIQAGSYEVADAMWEAEVTRRDSQGERSGDASLQVARAFLAAAQSIEASDPTNAKVAGSYAHLWGDAAATDLRNLDEDDTSAEALMSQALRFIEVGTD